MKYNKKYKCPTYERSYKHKDSHSYSKDYMYKLEPTGMPFDFYCPSNYKDYEGVYEPVDFYVIRDGDLLARELKELYTVPALPDFYWNGEYISKGIINFDREQMFKYIFKKHPDIIPMNGENNRYIDLCSEYIADSMYSYVHTGTIDGDILAYRMRYVFHPAKHVFFPNDVRALTWLFYKHLMNYTTAYTFTPLYQSGIGVATFDVIISNGTRHPGGYNNHNKRVRTLYNYMTYMPRTINSDITSVVFGINPKTEGKLSLR